MYLLISIKITKILILPTFSVNRTYILVQYEAYFSPLFPTIPITLVYR